MSKILVAYFSAQGTTAKVAKNLSDAIGADIFEIKPETEYTRKDLDWQDKTSRTTKEMNDKKFRPAMAKKIGSVDGYEKIFLGFPIWWYTAPRIINTFLESADFTGKKIILFATSGGSGLQNVPADLEDSCPGATLVTGKMLNGNPSKDNLKSWAETF